MLYIKEQLMVDAMRIINVTDDWNGGEPIY